MAIKRILDRLATATYQGLNKVGKAVEKPVKNYFNKLDDIDHDSMVKNINMIQDNFGSVDNYLKIQEGKKKKP